MLLTQQEVDSQDMAEEIKEQEEFLAYEAKKKRIAFKQSQKAQGEVVSSESDLGPPPKSVKKKKLTK